MKKKIFHQFCLLTVLAVLLSSVLVTLALYNQFYEDLCRNVRSEAKMLSLTIQDKNAAYLTQAGSVNEDTRLTVIAPDGTVLFDNRADSATMENHLNRTEVQLALENGTGEITRYSNTLGRQTYYYALKLSDGNILRIAATIDSAFAVLINCIPWMLLIGGGVILFALLMAHRQTEKIVGPLNMLNLEKPLENDVYDELAPLLSRIEHQRIQIDRQMSTMRKKQKEFSAIAENMSEGLVTLRASGEVLTINKAAAYFLGVEENSCEGNFILALNRSVEMQNAVETAAKGKIGEEVLTLNDRSYQLMASPVFNEDVIQGTVLLILDITEKQLAEQMRREFTANVSHELKTPLTSISGYAELIQNGMAKPQDIPDFANRIYDEASRLIKLVEDIIELSRLDEAKVTLTKECVHLQKIAQQVAQRLQPTAEKRQVTLQVQAATAQDTVFAVPQLIEEMIYNLCDNAIKYNRPGGSVTIAVGPGPQGVMLTVSDTGIGIELKHQSRVFERFYRVDKSHSKATGGTGLGLSIVKHIAEYHGARIGITSRLGKGTTISVDFTK
ncbi:MAG: ATP-binding protein [Oscillospiraceae bacterium]|nr:ATP-binding protein [Oscillospiraceae bacterium]